MTKTQHTGLATAALGLVAALGLSACASGSGSTPSPSAPVPSATRTTALAGPAGPDRIAFTRWDTPGQGDPELWTGNIDGSDLQPVGDQHGYFPDWSPDRTHLLFDFFDENGENQIATIRPDGTEFTQLTHDANNEAADYSPDGTTIAFDRYELPEHHPDFTTMLMVMDADGANIRPLLDPAEGGFDYEPEYSPDGSQITFIRFDQAADTAAVYLAGADGTNVRQLSPYVTYVEHSRWSPDGATIIYNIEYQQNLDDPRNGIWTIPTAGGEPTQLHRTDENLHGFKPDYSPSGDRILFGCFARVQVSDELCVMNADGTAVERLTRTPTFENHPVWD